MAGHIPDSLSVDWCSPDWICECLKELFDGPPDLDPCSNRYSHVNAKEEFTLEKGNDGLIDVWNGQNIYVNPPFGFGWQKERDHTPACLDYLNKNAVPCIRIPCICASQYRRDYIWPSDRAAKKAELSSKDFKTWIKQYTRVDTNDWLRICSSYGDAMTAVPRNVVALIPAYVDTNAWQKYVWKRAQAVFFPKGRLHFRLVYAHPDGSTTEKTGPAPMGCGLPLWTTDKTVVDKFGKVFGNQGHVELL